MHQTKPILVISEGTSWTEMFPTTEAFMRSFFLAESAVVCLSSDTEILMEKPPGSLHPLAYFSSLEEDGSCERFATLFKESKSFSPYERKWFRDSDSGGGCII